LQLAQDGRSGEAREGDSSLGLVAIYRIEQTEAGDLVEIVAGLRSGPVTPSQVARVRQVAPHQLLPGGGVFVLPKPPPQLALVREAPQLGRRELLACLSVVV